MSKPKHPSQIRSYLALTYYALKASIRNRSTLFFSIIFPLVFIGALGLIGGNGVSVKIGIPDGQEENPVTSTVSAISAVKVQHGTASFLTGELSKGKIDALLTVEKKDGKKYNARLITSNANPTTAGAARALVSGVINTVNLRLSGVTDPPVAFMTAEIAGRTSRYIDFVLPGQIGFSLLSTALFGTVFGFIALRRLLVFKRMFVTPTRPATILLSQSSSRLIMALFQTTIILAVGIIFFHFYLPHGFITFLELLVISAIGLVSFLGFGFFLSGIADDENSAGPLVNLVSMPQLLLSGVFFPIDLLPTWLQPVANNLPLSYFNQAVRTVTTEGGNFVQTFPYLLGVIVWGVIMYILATRTFKWE